MFFFCYRIRARFSKDGSQNATHGSDSDTNVKKEIEFIFSSSVCSAETQDTAAANNHVDQQDDSASSSESQQVKEEMTHNSNTENGATIHHHDETVSSTEEKANNASTPSTTNIALNNDANDPETEVKSNISITPALVDDQINGVMQTAEETDQSIIVGNTSKTQDKPADANKENDKHIDKNTIIDQAKDIKPNDNQKVEKSDAIANTAAAIETVTTVTTEIVTSSTEAAVTTVVSDISTENTKNEEHHDGTESSNVQIKPSESNTGATPQTKTENDLVMEDNKSNAAENDILLAQQSKGEQQCDSVANNEDKKSNITPSPKEKDDFQAQNETKQSQEASGEKNEAVSTPKDEHISSEKNEKLSASREQVKTNQRPEDKEGKKVILEVKEKTRSPQTTPTISPKNKLLTKSTKEANNVKGDKVRPSISRIPPPSIKRGQSTSLISSLKSTVSSTKQLLGPERRLRTASITGAKAMTNGHASAGATRIARLSSASTNSSSSSDQEKKPANPQAKKPLTKVSKHLPRVATMTTTQQKPLPSAQPNVKKESTGEKPKKRVSSTKSFISRLTAPTVASANKKSDHHETAIQHNSSNGVVRRTTLTKKQGLVKPSHSTGTSKVL
jgi:hypothetical protein